MLQKAGLREDMDYLNIRVSRIILRDSKLYFERQSPLLSIRGAQEVKFAETSMVD